jgi:hypothetical protein
MPYNLPHFREFFGVESRVALNEYIGPRVGDKVASHRRIPILRALFWLHSHAGNSVILLVLGLPVVFSVI